MVVTQMEEINMVKEKKIITAIFCLWTFVLIGQNNGSLLQGKVSFITSKNVYVKFDNTAEIAIGDTLYLSGRNDLRPCLVVHHKSKTSCATSIQEGCSTKKDAIIFHKGKEEQNAERILQTDTIKVSSAIATAQADTTKKDKLPSKNQENLSARLMVATYSTLAENNNRHRVAYRLNMNALNIKNSKFSAEAYINYWKNYIPKEKTYEQQTSFLRIYSFAAKYALNKSTTIDIGRKINQKFSSIGAVDGVQIEKYFGKNYAGAIAGFRPDIYNFGFNANLMQYGAYIGRSTISDKLNTETTLGFIEQHNHKPVDRRYAYFQNSMTIHQNLNLFSSAEVDLFNQILTLEENFLKSKGIKLSMSEVHTLEAIEKSDDKSMSEIAKRLRITQGTLTVNINRLTKKGFVYRVQDEKDRRRYRLKLTDKATDILKIHDVFHEELIDELVANLSHEEKELLIHSLSDVNQYFEKLSTD